MSMGKHGVTANTAKNILLGAGTFHKGLKYEDGAWTGVCIGATSGGGKVSIEGEYLDLELDGALVLVKGLTVKQGGKATMEVSMAELTSDNIRLATNFAALDSDIDMLYDKPNIEEHDYTDDFGFVGTTATGENIVIVFESALCKSAFELESKNKEQTVLKLVMEAYAKNEGDLNTIPVKIYLPIG